MEKKYSRVKIVATGRALRIIDIAIIFLLSPFWVPVFFLVATICRIGQGSPVFFTQERLGLGAKPIEVTKFRTMIKDADSFLDAEGRPTCIRVTVIGRYLRKSGLDELPQIINVLRGDMSLVGPRPVLPSFLKKLEDGEHHPRFLVRPGITGKAQVAGRNMVKWSERLDLDAQFVSEFSLGQYIQVLLHTPLAILKPTVSSDRNGEQVDDLMKGVKRPYDTP